MDTVYCRSSRAPLFSSMNPISTYTSAAKPGFASINSLSRKVDTHAFQRRTSTTGLERRKRCNVHLSMNASLEPKSESTEKETGSSPQQAVLGESVQAHLDLLERFTSDSGLNTAGKTIAQQLQEDLEQENVEELTVPLGNGKLETAPLTISQKRNIRRQNYLNEVSKRNDAPFFTTVALFVIVPPVVILGVAVATGYVDLVP